MKMKKLWTAFGLVLFTLTIAHADMPNNGSEQRPGQTHKSVVGTVNKATEEMLTLQIDGGTTTRNFTVKSAAREGIIGLKKGDRVVLEFDEGNQIVDIIHIGAKHQLVHGSVMGVDKERSLITIQFEDGKSQSFRMKEAMAAKMNNIKKGAEVTMMVDQHNNSAMDVHID
jgi:Cu/Ag efflux protein CusF